MCLRWNKFDQQNVLSSLPMASATASWKSSPMPRRIISTTKTHVMASAATTTMLITVAMGGLTVVAVPLDAEDEVCRELRNRWTRKKSRKVFWWRTVVSVVEDTKQSLGLKSARKLPRSSISHCNYSETTPGTSQAVLPLKTQIPPMKKLYVKVCQREREEEQEWKRKEQKDKSTTQGPSPARIGSRTELTGFGNMRFHQPAQVSETSFI